MLFFWIKMNLHLCFNTLSFIIRCFDSWYWKIEKIIFNRRVYCENQCVKSTWKTGSTKFQRWSKASVKRLMSVLPEHTLQVKQVDRNGFWANRDGFFFSFEVFWHFYVVFEVFFWEGKVILEKWIVYWIELVKLYLGLALV